MSILINPEGIKPVSERFEGTIIMINANDPMAYAGTKHLDADGNNWIPVILEQTEGICENCNEEDVAGYVQNDTTGRLGVSMFFCNDCSVTFYANRHEDFPGLQYFVNTDNYYLED